MAINQRKAGTILSYAHIIIGNTISLIYTPIMLKMLGQSEYGLFGTANSVTSYLSLFSFGISGAYIRFNSLYRAKGDKEGEAKLNGVFFSIFSFLALLVLITGSIMVIFADNIFGNSLTDTELKKIKIIMILSICQFVVTFLFNTVAMVIQAYEKYIFIKSAVLIAGIVQPMINLVVLYFGGKAVSISVISLAVSILTYSTYVIYAKKSLNMKFDFHGLDKLLIKNVFVFSGFLFINSITDQITGSTDTLLLGMFSGTNAVAIYTIGATFGRYFMSISTSVSSVFSPQINKIVAEDKNNNVALNEIFQRIGRVQCLIVSFILIAYIIFGLHFINLWAGEEYGITSYFVGLFLLLATYVPLFQNIGIEIQKAKNMHKARSIVYFLVAVVNVLLTIGIVLFLKNYFGSDSDSFKVYASMGAAFMTMFCYICGNDIFMNIYYHKKVGLDIITFWKKILRLVPGFLIPIAFGAFITYVFPIDSFLVFLVEAILFTVVFFISVWFLSMNEYEKELLSAPIKKIAGKLKRIKG